MMIGNGPTPRMEGLDAFRGFALMALFIVHMPEMFELYWVNPAPSPVRDWVFALFAGKAFALLALSFGVSFFILMDRAERRGERYALRFVWRMILLGLLGWLHGLLYQGDILQVLALAGLILVPFERVRSNTVLTAVAILLLLQPVLLAQAVAAADGAEWARRDPRFWTAYDFPLYVTGGLGEVVRHNMLDGQWPKWLFFLESGRMMQVIGLFLLGLVLGRIGFFSAPERHQRLRLGGLAIAILAYGLLYFAGPTLAGLAPAGPGARILGNVLESYGALALVAVWLFGFTALYYDAKAGALRALAPAGRMTLSLYVAQSLVFVPLFYPWGLGLYDSMSQSATLGWGLVAIAVQILVATLWFRGFHYGPLEWLWRAGTNLTPAIPFRRR